MHLRQDNHIVQLCAQGMEQEGNGQPARAALLFTEAWNKASNDFEKFLAAHYVARHQKSVAGKLQWDQLALQHALNLESAIAQPYLPSLYLNIGKCYEDLQDTDNAKKHYQLAASYITFLPDDGYGAMIKRGITNGLARTGHDTTGNM